MSVFPIHVETTYLEHNGGTKFYRIVRLACANGKVGGFYNFGPLGKSGQMMTMPGAGSDQKVLDKDLSSRLKDKTRNGYGGADDPSTWFKNGIAQNESQLRDMIGGSRFVADQNFTWLNLLDTGLAEKVRGFASGPSAAVQADADRRRADLERQEDVKRQARENLEIQQRNEAQARIDRLEAERQRQRSDPTFGMF